MTLKLNGSASGYTAIDAPAAAGSNTLTLPADNGSNGQFLQTNGSGALSFATVSTESNLPCFQGENGYNSVQNITNQSTWNKLDFSQIHDSGNMFDPSTDRFTPTVAGYYFIWAHILFQGNTNSPHAFHIAIFKNGTSGTEVAKNYCNTMTNAFWINHPVQGIASLNGSGDYVEAYVQNVPDSGTTTVECRTRHFGGFRLGPNS